MTTTEHIWYEVGLRHSGPLIFWRPLAWVNVVVNKVWPLQSQGMIRAMADLAFRNTFWYFHDAENSALCFELCAVDGVVTVPGAVSVRGILKEL